MQFNNNKYYLLQLLEHNKTKTYCVWFRWGRVGKTGQSTYEKCGSDLEKAKNVFCRKFFDKTKNEWDDKDNFEKVPGKYDIVDKDYAAGDEDDDDNDKDEVIECIKHLSSYSIVNLALFYFQEKSKKRS